MTEHDATLQFRTKLEAVLDEYHPGWDIRRRATWHPEYDEIWQQNRRFQVWVDTLKRWVRGENFPRVKKFQGFLEKTNFPPELREELLTLYHRARQARRAEKKNEENQPPVQAITHNEHVSEKIVAPRPLSLGQRPLSPAQYFVGRANLRRTLQNWLGQDDSRIISIIGRSGIGKTALACQVLYQLENMAEDQEIDAFIYLSTPLTDLSINTLFQILLELHDEATQAQLQDIWASNLTASEKIVQWVASLEPYTLYILLDNLEDILHDDGRFKEPLFAEFIAKAIGMTDTLYIVMTSQIEANLAPSMRHLHQILLIEEGLPRAEGIQLLQDLDPNGHYGLRDASPEILSATVARVHGIPRALQILVGILEDDPLARLEDILSEFSQFEDVHQIITHTLTRLEEDTRWVLRGLAVIQQSTSMETLHFLLEPFASDIQIQNELKRLMRMHLIKIDRANALITLNPIEADVVYQDLRQHGLHVELELRAAAYYTQFKYRERYTYEDFLPHLIAFDHFVRGEAHQQAYELIGEDGFATLLKLGYSQRVIEMREVLSNHLASAHDELVNDYGHAIAVQRSGHRVEAIHMFKGILHRTNRLNPTYEKLCLVKLGELWGQKPQEYEKALQIDVEPPTHEILAANHQAHLGLSRIYLAQGDYEQALAHTQTALALVEDAGNPVLMGNSLELLADIYRNLVQHEYAFAHNADALQIAQQMHDSEAEIYRLRQHCYLVRDLGQFNLALQDLNAAMKIAVDKSLFYEQIHCLLGLSEVLLYQGDYQWGLNCARSALELAEQVANERFMASCYVQLSHALVFLDDIERARVYLEQIGEPHVGILKYYLQISAYLGDKSGTQKAAQKILETLSPWQDYQALVGYGLSFIGTNPDQAHAALHQALLAIDELVARVPNLWEAHYTKGLALSGLAMLTTHNTQITALTSAQDAYQIAIQSCQAEGVVTWARYQLDSLRTYDVTESLEPLRRILTLDD